MVWVPPGSNSFLTRPTVKVKTLPEWNLISVENFAEVNSQERILINNSIEKNYLKDPLPKSMQQNQFPLYDDHTSFFSDLFANNLCLLKMVQAMN